MGKDITITCDCCNADLTVTGNCEDYRLTLTVEHIPSWGGAVTAMAAWPPLSHDAYFCNIKCLKDWIAKLSQQY